MDGETACFHLMPTRIALIMALSLWFVNAADARNEWSYESHNAEGQLEESLSIYLFDDSSGLLWFEYIYVFNAGKRTRSAVSPEGRRLLSSVDGLDECYHFKMFGSDEARLEGEELTYLICILGNVAVLTNISGKRAAILPNYMVLRKTKHS